MLYARSARRLPFEPFTGLYEIDDDNTCSLWLCWPFLVVAGNLDLQRPNAQVAKAVAKFGGTTLMNAQNDKGNTGLHFLVQYGYTELAESARRSRPKTASQDSHL